MKTLEIVAAALAVAGAISTLGGAANYVVKLVQVVKSPNAEQNQRLAQLEKRMEEVDTFRAESPRGRLYRLTL